MSLEIKREIPGDYGVPIFGGVVDRLDHFYGKDFFERRIAEYNSTVFRVNMPFFPSSHVITVLDQKCFPVLFDITKVSKRDTLTGTYIPSTGFTGGFKVLAYLDPIEDEAKHIALKSFCFDIIKSNSNRWIHEVHTACAREFAELDSAFESRSSGFLAPIMNKSTPEVNPFLGKIALAVLTKTILDKDATQSTGFLSNVLTETGIKLWVAAQIAPVYNAGLPAVIQEPLMHTAPIPFVVVEPEYLKIVQFFSANGSRALDLAKSHGIERDEALHNLIFFVRTAVDSEGGSMTMNAIDLMPMLQSTIYEVLRIKPPVPSQYGRARKDFVIETHTEAFQVKKGEMLYGYQPIVTRDPKVFIEPEKFMPKRFMGEDGHKLLQYLFWSNGPETSNPTTQCGGKNVVVLLTQEDNLTRLWDTHINTKYRI